jgi:peroxiredoxin Q/BCP
VPALKIGDPAPDFTMPDQTGEPVSLRGLRGKQVVLYFYPKDDTPGCTIEACGFRDASASVEQAGAVVLGVSADGQASHQHFSKKFNLPFRLLSDEDGTVQRAYGVAWPVIGLVPALARLAGPRRRTFVIGPDGRLKAIFPNVNVEHHAQEVLAALKL